MKSSKSGHQHTSKKLDKIDSVALTKSKSVTDIPTSSHPLKEKERTSLIPILKTRKHKVDTEQTIGIEFENRSKRNSLKHHHLEEIHKIDNIESQHTRNNHQEPSTSTNDSLLTEIGKKHKSKKDKHSRFPNNFKTKKTEEDKKEKSKEEVKIKDRSKLHKNYKNNFNNSQSEISFKEKDSKSKKGDKKHSSFSSRYTYSVDNLEASTSSGNQTYPQVNI